MEHGVTPVETVKYISNYAMGDDYSESEGGSQWTDLAKIVCENVDFGPPPRPKLHKPISYEVLKEELPEDISVRLTLFFTSESSNFFSKLKKLDLLFYNCIPSDQI